MKSKGQTKIFNLTKEPFAMLTFIILQTKILVINNGDCSENCSISVQMKKKTYYCRSSIDLLVILFID